MKSYNNEVAIISLTSWKKRIDMCSKTIFSLLTQCPGFHIVLVLSVEEFPQMEDELPVDLIAFVENDLIEILWIQKNYKAFKKWIFTSQHYPNLPIITADDDCIYQFNYVKELYCAWSKNKTCIITYIAGNPYEKFPIRGCATLYPPSSYKHFIDKLSDKVIALELDDPFYSVVIEKLKLDFLQLNKDIRYNLKFHTKTDSLSNIYMHNSNAIPLIYEKYRSII